MIGIRSYVELFLLPVGEGRGGVPVDGSLAGVSAAPASRTAGERRDRGPSPAALGRDLRTPPPPKGVI